MSNLVPLTEDQKAELAAWIHNYLTRINSDIRERRTNWDNYTRQFKTKPKNPHKTFPWDGCSNIVVPELKIACHGVTSFAVVGVLAQKPMLRFKPYKADIAEGTRAAEIWFEVFAKNVLHLQEYWRKAFPLYALYGTEVMKFHESDVTTPFGPDMVLEHIPLHRFECHPSELTVKDARLIGNVFIKPIEWVKEMEEQNNLYEGTLKNIQGQQTSSQFKTLDKTAKYTESTFSPWSIPFHDLYVTYTSDNMSDFVGEHWRVIYYEPTQTVVAVEECSPSARPYIVIPYFPVDDSIFGEGVGDWAYNLQEALDTSVNQLIDSSTLRNKPIFRGGINTDAETELYPGKIIRDSDFSAIQTQDVHQSAIYIINFIRTMIWLVAGVNENALGMDSSVAKTRQTLGGQSLNIQRSGVRFALHLFQFADSLTELAWRVLERIATNYPNTKLGVGEDILDLLRKSDSGLSSFLDEDSSEALSEKIFSAPEAIKNRNLFSIEVSTNYENEATERQAMMILFQLAQKYIQQIMAFAQQLSALQNQPQGEVFKQTILQAWHTTNQIMEKVFSTYMKSEAKDLLVELKEVMSELTSLSNPLAGMGGPGAAPPIPGNNGEAGGGPSMGGLSGMQGALPGALGTENTPPEEEG